MALTLSTFFFVLINFVVTPFYLLMGLAPRHARTRRLMNSLWPVALPVLVHVAFILAITLVLRPDVLALWRELYVDTGMLGAGTVQFFTRVYAAPEYATLHGWVHVVAGDLFMARWAYLDALQRAAPAWLIGLVAVLICFVGPLGVLVYLLARRRYPGRPAGATPA